MTSPAEDRCCARIPARGLSHLADLRANREVRVQIVEDRAWLYWPAGEDAVLHRVLAIGGVDLFLRHNGLWYRPGQRLPSFHVPVEDETQALLAVLTPAPVQVDDSRPSPFQPLPLVLVRDERPRTAMALLCRMTELARWADRATTRDLTSLQAARCDAEALLLGTKLPALREGKRFWGHSILIPLGFRAQPALAESTLREALGLRAEELGLLSLVGQDADPARGVAGSASCPTSRSAGIEVISRSVFAPLTRAAVRLAGRECV